MDIQIRQHRRTGRSGDRIRLHSRLQLTTRDGKPIAPFACCTNIGLGGLRVTAAKGVPPGTIVQVEMRLPSGRSFKTRGHVVWLTTTLRPRLLGTPTGGDDDASFGIAFDDVSTQSLLPIACLFAARDAERGRARRIRRLHNLPIHA
jgi:hypothetical protein